MLLDECPAQDAVSRSSVVINTSCIVRSNETSDLLNMGYICDRRSWHMILFIVLYSLVALGAIVSNASVVLASIVERWKEIDQFTFVFAVSLSFNHFLVALLVYPMGSYIMACDDGWTIGHLWCNFTAYCNSYFEVLYMMHVLMIGFDMLVYTFTRLKDVVKVFLCKKVAMSLWVSALIPHLLLLFQPQVLHMAGTLGRTQKYWHCIAGEEGGEPWWLNATNCYVSYTFKEYHDLNMYFLFFVILPFTYVSGQYTILLYLRKRNMFKNKDNIELLDDEKTFIQRYKASVCMITVFTITQVPKWITVGVFLHSKKDGKREEPYNLVVGMDFLNFWTSLGSVLIPVCYMMTCPTYFHAVTETKALSWLRRYGKLIHGRGYSEKYHVTQPLAKPVNLVRPIQSPLPSLSIIAEMESDDLKTGSLVYENSTVKLSDIALSSHALVSPVPTKSNTNSPSSPKDEDPTKPPIQSTPPSLIASSSTEGKKAEVQDKLREKTIDSSMNDSDYDAVSESLRSDGGLAEYNEDSDEGVEVVKARLDPDHLAPLAGGSITPSSRSLNGSIVDLSDPRYQAKRQLPTPRK